MDRRTFLAHGVFLAPLLVGLPAVRRAPAREPLALVTADTEAHVVVVSLASGRVVRRVRTREGPRSIEAAGRGRAVVGHASPGAVTLLGDRPLEVQRVLGGFAEPRYTAVAPDRRHAFVTDSGHGEVAVIDLARRRVVHRAAIGDGARHVSLSPDGRTLWVALGSSAAAVAVVDVSDPERPRVRRRVRPPFLAHDVGFAPGGGRVWVTAGRERRIAVFAAGGAQPIRVLDADAAPQHVCFGADVAYVASGEGGTLRVHSLRDGRLRRETAIARGSYNVQRGGGRVLTPSLGVGTLTVLDASGTVLRRVRVAPAAHDACVV